MITLKAIGIITKNMEKTLEFYRTLGLDIPATAGDSPNFDFQITGGPVLGFLDEAFAREADSEYKPSSGSAPINLQFMVEAPDRVDETYQRLVRAGHWSYSEPWDAFWGQRFARVVDPDGRVVNIYAHLEQA